MTVTLQNVDEDFLDILKSLLKIKKDVSLVTDNPPQLKSEILEAISDVENNRNLHGPFKNAKDAIASMLED